MTTKYRTTDAEQPVLDPCGALLEPERNLVAQLCRQHRVHQLRQRAEGADPAAVERPHNTVDTTVKIANIYQVTLYLTIGRFQSMTPNTLTIEMRKLFANPRYTTAATSADVLEALALAEEAEEREGQEERQQHEVERLRPEDLRPRLDRLLIKTPGIHMRCCPTLCPMDA